MNAIQFRKLIEEQGKLAAVNSIEKTANEQQADLFIWKYFSDLLAANEKTAAAILIWGDKIFNPRPQSVKNIWDAIEKHPLSLLMGAGGLGKTLTPVCWLLLDWLRDPQYTNTKLISATKGHATSNAYSDMVRMHRSSIIKLPGEPTGDYIGLDSKEKKSGIAVIAIPMGSDGKGRLQGFHPHPRPKEHPTLGPASRVRAYMDECEKIPKGLWDGIDNMKVSLDGTDAVKAVGSYNPNDQTSPTAQNAEPKDGWGVFDVERGVNGQDHWVSKEDWFVLRLDGKKSENVRSRKTIFPGLITYEGYRNLELKNGGNSIDYYVFARGAYPPEGSIGVLIPSGIFQGARGEFVFVGPTIKAAGVDIAVDGRDACVMSVGRSGIASAFQPRNGKLIKFEEAKRVLQLDQQFVLKKGTTKIVGDDIIRTSKQLSISPEYVCLDATGNGSAVYSYVKAIWSEDVQGVDFNKPSTTTKILEQDQFTPEELYDGIVTEVLFALAKWMEFGFLAIAPGVRKDPLESECLSRRYVIGVGKKLKAEKKDDYKLRMGKGSPDFLDSFSLLLHGVRSRIGMMASMLDNNPEEPTPIRPVRPSPVDRVEWLHDSAV